MHGKTHPHNFFLGSRFSPASATLAVMVALLLLIFFLLFVFLTAQPASGQTYKVIYNAGTGYGAGAFPFGGVTIDAVGDLYVTTAGAFPGPDRGTVFMLSPAGLTWTYTLLHSFGTGDDGANPYDRVVFGPDGNLYGATASGSGQCQGYGCGTIFRLSRRGSAWDYSVLYRFRGGYDGSVPYSGDLVFDPAGSLYGTTQYGGTGCWGDGCGTVFQLAPSNGGWIHSVLYQFNDGDDGAQPSAGVIFDSSGNLYGVSGPVYEMSPSSGGWSFTPIYRFAPGQGGPVGGLVFDNTGSLYGTTYNGGFGNGGTLFELTPFNGGLTYHQLHSFVTPFAGGGRIYYLGGPTSSLTLDAAGNIYGTTYYDGLYGFGSVFKLTRSGSGWTYTALHNFCSTGRPCIDGQSPAGGVTIDSHGNLFGTTEYGGPTGGGVVWEITP